MTKPTAAVVPVVTPQSENIPKSSSTSNKSDL